MIRYADPLAQAEIDRLRAKIARVEALAGDLLRTYDCYDDDDLAIREHVVPAIRAALADPKDAS